MFTCERKLFGSRFLEGSEDEKSDALFEADEVSSFQGGPRTEPPLLQTSTQLPRPPFLFSPCSIPSRLNLAFSPPRSSSTHPSSSRNRRSSSSAQQNTGAARTKPMSVPPRPLPTTPRPTTTSSSSSSSSIVESSSGPHRPPRSRPVNRGKSFDLRVGGPEEGEFVRVQESERAGGWEHGGFFFLGERGSRRRKEGRKDGGGSGGWRRDDERGKRKKEGKREGRGELVLRC